MRYHEYEILNEVCLHFDVTPEELIEKDRRYYIKTARHMFFLICRKHTPLSFVQIGNVLKRHHASVIHACRNMEWMTREEHEHYDAIMRRLQTDTQDEYYQMFCLLGKSMNIVNSFDFIVNFRELAA